MPAPARKATPRKASPSVAARREVRSEKAAPVTYKVPFRGETFEITLDKLATQKVVWRERAVAHFANVDTICSLLFEVLGQVNSAKFISLMKPGDELLDAAGQFMSAFRKATNDPNS